MTTIITIPADKVLERLDNGRLWMHGWGTPDDPTKPTCLYGAIRYCQPIPGDAHLIEQVGAHFGFGTKANDAAETFATVKDMLLSHTQITDDMLETTFGPQWEPIVALVRRAAVLTADEALQLDAAWDAAWGTAWYAAWDAVWGAARGAAREAAWGTAWYAARGAVQGLVVRDLIGSHGFTQSNYDLLTGPWAKVIGPVHPDDTPRVAP